VLGVTGNGACLGWYLPEVLRPTVDSRRDPRRADQAQEERAAAQRSLRMFAGALAHVLAGKGAVRREPPPWDPELVARGPLRPDDVIRNHPAVRQALYEAYVSLGGEKVGLTGREIPLKRLAILLTALWPTLWPPALRTDPKRGAYRALKVETNRLRRELALRGVVRRRVT